MERLRAQGDDGENELDDLDNNDHDNDSTTTSRGTAHDRGEGMRAAPRAFESYRFLAKIVDKIYEVCQSLQQAVREYYELPPADQQQVWDDMVGKGGTRRVFVQGHELFSFAQEYEPSSMVRDSLQQLKDTLDNKLPANQKVAYEQALAKTPSYVQNQSFLLKFLRAEKFNVMAAAERLTRHFEEKAKLFGSEKLGRDITLEDFTADDLQALQNGYLQVLDELDQGNRQVIFYYKAINNTKGTCDCYKERENIVSKHYVYFIVGAMSAAYMGLLTCFVFNSVQLRSFWYVANTLSMDEKVQKLGVVNVVYNVGGFPKHGMDYEKSRWLSRLFRAIPLRFNSFYVLLDESAWVTVVETFAVRTLKRNHGWIPP